MKKLIKTYLISIAALYLLALFSYGTKFPSFLYSNTNISSQVFLELTSLALTGVFLVLGLRIFLVEKRIENQIGYFSELLEELIPACKNLRTLTEDDLSLNEFNKLLPSLQTFYFKIGNKKIQKMILNYLTNYVKYQNSEITNFKVFEDLLDILIETSEFLYIDDSLDRDDVIKILGFK